VEGSRARAMICVSLKAEARSRGRKHAVRKHNWKALGAAAFILLVLLLALRYSSHASAESNADRSLRENYERIEDGMAYAKVIEFLGQPGDHPTESGEILVPFTVMHMGPYCEWYTDTVGVVVYFDSSYRVVNKYIGDVHREEPSWAQILSRRIKRWWRR